MSVIVKGMDMPKNCDECDIHVCKLWLRMTIGQRSKGKHPSCPLVEIPTPHGRLGDLDALYAEISNGNKAYNGIEGYDGEYQHIGNVDDCLDVIKYAETVIEAEGEAYA